MIVFQTKINVSCCLIKTVSDKPTRFINSNTQNFAQIGAALRGAEPTKYTNSQFEGTRFRTVFDML